MLLDINSPSIKIWTMWIFYKKRKNIIKYMITLPVSGSRNVNIDGIKVIINASKITLLSLLFNIFDKYIINTTFMNSDGWNAPNLGILNHAFEPFIDSPKNNTRINKTIVIMYRKKPYL